MTTKAQKKKARKFAHEVKMKIRLRSKGPVAHMKAANPRKRDRVFAVTPIEERKSAWQKFKAMIREKMATRIDQRKNAEKAKRPGYAVGV